MKLFTCLSLFVFVFNSNAQKNLRKITKGAFEDYYFLEKLENSSFQAKFIRENTVKQKISANYSKRNSWKTIETYNKNGCLLKRETIGAKYQTTRVAEYDENSVLKKVIITNYKGQKSTSTFNYENEKLLSKETINYRGNYFVTKKKYNKDGKLTHHLIYEKSKTIPIKELIYEYFDGGSKKSIIYKKKGEQKYEWTFECSEKGEKVSVTKKASSAICILEEVDENGNTVTWSREFTKDGALVKTKTIKNTESKMISKEVFNEDDRLIRKNYFKPNGGYREEWYDKKGAISSSTESFFNSENQIIRNEYKAKRYSHISIIAYKNNLEEVSSSISKYGVTVKQFQYEFFE